MAVDSKNQTVNDSYIYPSSKSGDKVFLHGNQSIFQCSHVSTDGCISSPVESIVHHEMLYLLCHTSEMHTVQNEMHIVQNSRLDFCVAVVDSVYITLFFQLYSRDIFRHWRRMSSAK